MKQGQGNILPEKTPQSTIDDIAGLVETYRAEGLEATIAAFDAIAENLNLWEAFVFGDYFRRYMGATDPALYIQFVRDYRARDAAELERGE